MKNILTTAILLFSLTIFAQNRIENNNITRTEVYSYTNGIRDIVPTQIVETDRQARQFIYNTTNGIQDIVPTQIIEKQNNTKLIYDVKNGIQELFPRLEVRTESVAPIINNFVPNPFIFNFN